MSSPAEMKQRQRIHEENMKSQEDSARLAKVAVGVAILSLVVSVALHFVG